MRGAPHPSLIAPLPCVACAALVLLAGCAGTDQVSAVQPGGVVARQAALGEEVRQLREQVRALSSIREEYDHRLSDDVLKKPLQNELDGFGRRLGQVEARLNELDERLSKLESSVSAGRAAWEEKMETVLEVVKRENAQLREAIAGLQKSGASMGWEHTVQPGETLAGIAKEYDARLRDIVEVNEIDNPHRIQVGQTLFIPRPAR
jgi:LysM repeat protein